MYLQNTDHGYLLESTTLDYSKQVMGDEGRPVPAKEIVHEYHRSLKDAVDSLLLRDIRIFDIGPSTPPESNLLLKEARIFSIDGQQPILHLQANGIPEAILGGPPAGIYIITNQLWGSISQLESLIGYDLSGLPGYAPNANKLQIAKYAYNERFEIGLNFTYDTMVHDRKISEQFNMYAEDDWEYKIQLEKSTLQYPNQHETFTYHYYTLGQAFADLLQLDIWQLNRNLLPEDKQDSWLSKAMLSERKGGQIVELISVFHENQPHWVSSPGIHLKFYWDIDKFESHTGIDLSAQTNYGDDEQHLLLAHYTRNYDALLPTSQFNALKDHLAKGISDSTGHQQQENNNNNTAPFILKIEWEVSSTPEMPKSITITEVPYSSNEAAFNALVGLADELFTRYTGDGQRKQVALRASVFENKQEIISKLFLKSEHKEIPSGVYMKINQESLSIEVLKLLSPYMDLNQQLPGAHLLVIKMNDDRFKRIHKPRGVIQPKVTSNNKNNLGGI